MRSLIAVVIALVMAMICTSVSGAAADGHLRQLRFSPDGRYVLAQDYSTVTVLTVRPLAAAFQIPAENASVADFTPDSRQITFLSSASASVERWSVDDHMRVASTSVALPKCGTIKLSPNGLYLACDQIDGTFRLLEVSSGVTLFENKHFGRDVLEYELADEDPTVPKEDVSYDGKLGHALISFSPDGGFLIAVPERAYGVEGLSWNLQQKRKVFLKGALRRLFWRADVNVYFSAPPFTFVAPDRAVISWPKAWNPKNTTVTATLASFPSGRTLLKPKIPPGPLFRAADPGFVIVRPCRQSPACAVELSSGQVIVSDTPALDILGQYYVAERPNGDLGLYERGKGLKASVSLTVH